MVHVVLRAQRTDRENVVNIFLGKKKEGAVSRKFLVPRSSTYFSELCIRTGTIRFSLTGCGNGNTRRYSFWDMWNSIRKKQIIGTGKKPSYMATATLQ